MLKANFSCLQDVQFVIYFRLLANMLCMKQLGSFLGLYKTTHSFKFGGWNGGIVVSSKQLCILFLSKH